MKGNRLCILFFLLAVQATAQTKRQDGFRYTATDSIITIISNQYEAGFFHRVMMGRNYRETWSTPVKLPVFHLSKSKLQIVELGGGQQTKSLRLKDNTGKEWVLRTVDKDVRAGLARILQNTLVNNIMQDMISASYPYSPIIVGQLAKALHITAADPQMYYVAGDVALGSYQSVFANTVCTLEERKPALNNSGIDDTEQLLEELEETNSHIMLQKKFLRARLLDMLVGDWDRHAGQWDWAEIDSTNAKYHYAIPKDRDAAFYYSKGPLMKLIQLTFMPYINGFKKNSSGLKKLNLKASDLDKSFLNELDAESWRQTIRRFQQLASDSVIEASLKILPGPAYALEGEKLINKIKSRRDGLLKNGMKYYRYLSATVTVNGSDEDELFSVSGRDKKLLVTVSRLNKNKPHKIIYERLFDPSETRVLLLNGLKGNDHFIIEESARTNIKLKISGNDGEDIYDVKGNTKVQVFDSKKEKNIVKNNSSAKICLR